MNIKLIICQYNRLISVVSLIGYSLLIWTFKGYKFVAIALIPILISNIAFLIVTDTIYRKLLISEAIKESKKEDHE
jgi:predicted exporter